MDETDATARIDLRRLWWAGPLTILAAVIVDLAIMWTARALIDVDPGFKPFSELQVAGLTVLGVGAGVAAFAVIARKASRPVQTFRVVALVALLLSFIPDIGLLVTKPYPGSEPAPVGILMLMHVAAAAITVGMLEALTVRRGRARPEQV